MSESEVASPRAPSLSAVEATHLVLPPDTNALGTAFGGRVMEWMDIAAGIAARRHAHAPAVTVAVDELVFKRPTHVGDVVIIRAMVNFAGRTSMEVGVRVDREDSKTGAFEHCLTGYFTFVAIDAAGRPILVPPIKPETEVECRRFAEAQARRAHRLRAR
jgi:acyl-CoA hydrolase